MGKDQVYPLSVRGPMVEQVAGGTPASGRNTAASPRRHRPDRVAVRLL